MTTDELVKINKNTFINVVGTLVKTEVFTNFPFLNVPPIKQIVTALINQRVKILADNLELGSYFIYIDYRVDAQGKEFVLAAHDAEKLQTEEARKKADEAFKKFFRFTSH